MRYTLLIGVAFTAVSCCAWTADDVARRYGPPDAIRERAGDLERLYAGDRGTDYPWPRARKTFYFLTDRRKAVIDDGCLHWEPLTASDEVEIRGFLSRRAAALARDGQLTPEMRAWTAELHAKVDELASLAVQELLLKRAVAEARSGKVDDATATWRDTVILLMGQQEDILKSIRDLQIELETEMHKGGH